MTEMVRRGKENKDDNFIYEGERGYYGRKCVNYLTKCEDCKWHDNYRCREGMVKG